MHPLFHQIDCAAVIKLPATIRLRLGHARHRGAAFATVSAALLLVFQILSLQAASVSPEWHDCLHGGCSGGHSPASGDADPAPEPHVCAVVILAQGMVMDVPAVAPSRIETAVDTLALQLQQELVPPAALTKSARAPPCI